HGIDAIGSRIGLRKLGAPHSVRGTEIECTPTMAEVPASIEDHGIIGDLRTVALVGKDGSFDYMCFPEFDSPTIFASLLDPDRGGRFQIAPDTVRSRQKQLYLPESNVLLTRFLFEDGVGEVSDFMCVQGETRALVRRAKSVRGQIAFRMICAPRFDYGRAR